jgi:glutamate 5-kinase
MKRIVIKIGSRILTNEKGEIDKSVISMIAHDIVRVRNEIGVDVIVVTSGAVSAGRSVISLKNYKVEKEAVDYKSSILEEQILAAAGQPKIMHVWVEALGACGVHCAQLLTTRSDFASRKHYLSIRSVVINLLKLGVVPIFNENDVLSPERLDFTDNDQQACMIAAMVSADKLFLMSDVDGVYDGSPKDARSKILSVIEDPLSYLENVDMLSGSGKGGMKSKLMAADLATNLGIDTHIVNGKTPDIISRVLGDETVGTHFPTKKLKGKVKPIKSWLASAASGEGGIVVSTYLADILKSKHVVSVLFSGIERVDGVFKEGGTVDIYNDKGEILGRGIVRYGAEDLKERLRGYKRMPVEKRSMLKSSEIIAIHYDYLVFF